MKFIHFLVGVCFLLSASLRAQTLDSTAAHRPPKLRYSGYLSDIYIVDGHLIPADVAETYMIKHDPNLYSEIYRSNQKRRASLAVVAGVIGFYIYDSYFNDYKFKEGWNVRDFAYLTAPALGLGYCIYLDVRAMKIKRNVVRRYNMENGY